MNKSEKEQAIENMYEELSQLMRRYAQSIKKDDFFVIKGTLLSRIRQIEREIQYLNLELKDERRKQSHQEFFTS